MNVDKWDVHCWSYCQLDCLAEEPVLQSDIILIIWRQCAKPNSCKSCRMSEQNLWWYEGRIHSIKTELDTMKASLDWDYKYDFVCHTAITVWNIFLYQWEDHQTWDLSRNQPHCSWCTLHGWYRGEAWQPEDSLQRWTAELQVGHHDSKLHWRIWSWTRVLHGQFKNSFTGICLMILLLSRF